jgi:hypothetical protein
MRYVLLYCLLILFISFFLIGCEPLMFVEEGGLAISGDVAMAVTEESGMMESIGVEARIGAGDGMAKLIIEDEPKFFSELAKVRMTEPFLEDARLYILEDGVKYEFASVRGTTEFGKTAIRFLKDGKEIGDEYSLPGRLCKVNSSTDLVRVRDGRGENFKVYTHRVHKDQIILVVEDHPVNGWYKIKTGMNDGEEFISAVLLSTPLKRNISTAGGMVHKKKESIDYLLICQSDSVCDYLNNIQDILSLKGYSTHKDGFATYKPADEELEGYYKKVILLSGSVTSATSSISAKVITTTFEYTLRLYDVKEKKYLVSKNERIVVVGFSNSENQNKLKNSFSQKLKQLL